MNDQDTSKFGQTIGLFLSTILITTTYDFFKQQMGLGKNFSTVIFIFIFFLVIIKITELLIVLSIEQSAWIKKMLLRGKYIDGFWVDIAVLGNLDEDRTDEGQTYDAFACIWIKQEKGHCRIEGKEYDRNCNLKCNWYSTAVYFNEPKLEYLFQASFNEPNAIKARKGFTNINMFGAPNVPPLAYGGIFIDVLEEDPRNPETRIGYIDGKKVPRKKAKAIQNDPTEIKKWIIKNYPGLK